VRPPFLNKHRRRIIPEYLSLEASNHLEMAPPKKKTKTTTITLSSAKTEDRGASASREEER